MPTCYFSLLKAGSRLDGSHARMWNFLRTQDQDIKRKLAEKKKTNIFFAAIRCLCAQQTVEGSHMLKLRSLKCNLEAVQTHKDTHTP